MVGPSIHASCSLCKMGRPTRAEPMRHWQDKATLESSELRISGVDEGRKAVMKKAIGYLARREHSCHELKRKLVNSGFSADIGELVIDDLKSKGLVSDRRFAEAYVRYRSTKGFGPVRIQMELGGKGVDSSLVEVVLLDQKRNWARQAVAVRAKKYGIERPDDFTERARQARFLQYRGFTGEQIQQAFDGDD